MLPKSAVCGVVFIALLSFEKYGGGGLRSSRIL